MTPIVRKTTLCLVPLALLTTPGRASGQSPTAAPPAGPLPQWNRIAGSPGTGCSHDSIYAFFVHPGSDRRLMIFFQGGGACWNNQNCDLQGRPTFHPQIDSTDDPNRLSGLFELSNPRNPVEDYSIVFVPYCTADVLLGARTVPYSIPVATPGTYPVATRCNVQAGCGSGHPAVDTIGVKITYQHTWVTPLANLVSLGGTGMTLTQSNAMRMEPVL